KERYPIIASQNPRLGHRAIRLRAVDDFLALDPRSRKSYASTVRTRDLETALYTRDLDPIDALLSDTPGVIVRTDFSDSIAWASFLLTLVDAEKELLTDTVTDAGSGAGPPPSSATQPVDADGDSSSDSGSDQDPAPSNPPQLTFFSICDPVTADDQARLEGTCNLAVLRLVADADVRDAPPVPQGIKRIKPGHRLVDLGGLQEIYRGRGVWIYDEQSNVDGAVRMVNLEGDVYGTATGDSWRVRASHITEIQVNMAFHGMKVDFGGMDRWDYAERIRNLEFANRAQVAAS
ncbi:hypothetical protein K488DRAFT_40048, partial [Vararia minispora EC-137]